MTESPETKVAVLEAIVAAMSKASDERARLQDARHDAVMAELKALRLEFAAANQGDEFRRGQAAGVAGTVKAAWAVVGVLGGAAVTWLLNRGA
jgi:hypothetical protein